MESEMAYTTMNGLRHVPDRSASSSLAMRFVDTVRLWRKRARDRAELAQLTARDARDLGIDPGQIVYESSKPFWVA
jgi:uncharacterized protein YjiS (DUF1127 family)